MNNIKLTLYKRERMKEQSRYLRYEEAVGSTGQSQGIYIQFLISIINYISGLHSPNGENDKLMKTIFIDNPFGAAKDVYIWEPIFALLKTNNVQLIVPARGATPAITARFDVNYILGQQMVGKRQAQADEHGVKVCRMVRAQQHAVLGQIFKSLDVHAVDPQKNPTDDPDKRKEDTVHHFNFS